MPLAQPVEGGERPSYVRRWRCGFAAPTEISADDLSAEKRTASPVGSGRVIGLERGRRLYRLGPSRAAVGKRKRPRGGGLSLALDGSFEVRAQGRSWGGEAQGEHFVSTDPRDTLPALCFNRVSWSAEMVSS